ncbi:MAG TPA: hypothetical protein VFR09_01175 [Alphaproteobacteria bacterium]|nr:hypothetical protein [Alphaproteobacteria bacterium]
MTDDPRFSKPTETVLQIIKECAGEVLRCPPYFRGEPGWNPGNGSPHALDVRERWECAVYVVAANRSRRRWYQSVYSGDPKKQLAAEKHFIAISAFTQQPWRIVEHCLKDDVVREARTAQYPSEAAKVFRNVITRIEAKVRARVRRARSLKTLAPGN